MRGRGADRAGPFGGASSEARPHRVACAPVVSQAAQSGSAAVERYLVISAPRAPDQRGFHHCMGRIGDAAAGSPWAAGRQAGGAPRAAAVRCERGRGGGALAGKVANADALPSLGPPSTEGSTEPTALPATYQPLSLGLVGLTAYPSPRSFELAAGQKAVEMQSRRNWRRFGPVLVSDPHDEAELEAVPKLIRMAFIVGSVVPRGLSAPRRADGGGRFGRRLCPDASSGLAHPTGTAPILFWLGSSHTTGRLCPYSCRGDGGNRRLTNEFKKSHDLIS